MFKGLTKKSLTATQANDVTMYLLEVLSSRGDVYNLSKDHLRMGLLGLADCERSQPTRYVHSIGLFIKETYPTTERIDELLSVFNCSPSIFSALINGNCKNWRRYFNFSDRNLVARNYADLFYAIWSSNLPRTFLQNKIAKRVSDNFGLIHGSLPQHAAVSILLGLHQHGVSFSKKDGCYINEVTSLLTNHPLKAAAFCHKGIAHQLLLERTSGLVTTRTTANYWCEIHLKIERNELFDVCSGQQVFNAALIHFKVISIDFYTRLSLIEPELLCMHPLKIRDTINALYIAWEFQEGELEDNLPVPTARALGAIIAKQKHTNSPQIKLRCVSGKNNNPTKKLTYDMPFWDTFNVGALSNTNESSVDFSTKFNLLSKTKQQLVLEMIEALS